MAESAVWVGNDNVVNLTGVVNAVTGGAISDATCQMTLYDEDEVAVTGQTFPVAMSATGGGAYTATLADTLDLIVGRNYKLVVDVAASGGLAAQFVRVLRARERS